MQPSPISAASSLHGESIRLRDAISDAVFAALKHTQQHIRERLHNSQDLIEQRLYQQASDCLRKEGARIQSLFDQMLEAHIEGKHTVTSPTDIDVIQFRYDAMGIMVEGDAGIQQEFETVFMAARQAHQRFIKATGATTSFATLKDIAPGIIAAIIQHSLSVTVRDSIVQRLLYRLVGTRLFVSLTKLCSHAARQLQHDGHPPKVPAESRAQPPGTPSNAVEHVSADALTSELMRLRKGLHLAIQQRMQPLLSQAVPTGLKQSLQAFIPGLHSMVMQDPAILGDRQHPAFIFIDAALALIQTLPGDDTYRLIDTTVRKIAKQDMSGLENLKEATGLMERYLNDNHAHQISSAQPPISPAQQHISPVQKFLDGTGALLHRELAFHRLMKFVFSAILTRIHHRHGEESSEWIHVTDHYRTALWSTQASATEEGKREVLRKLPDIVQSLREICHRWGVRDAIREVLLSRMFDLHVQIMHGRDGGLIEETPEMLKATFDCIRGDALQPEQHEPNAASGKLPLPIAPRDNVYERFDAISGFGTLSDAGSTDDLRAMFRSLEPLPLCTAFDITENGAVKRFLLREKSVRLGRYVFISEDRTELLTWTKAQLALAMQRGEATRIDDQQGQDEGLVASFRALKLA